MSSPAPDAAPAGKEKLEEARPAAAIEGQPPAADTEAKAAANGVHAPAAEAPDAANPPADAAPEKPANGSLAVAEPEAEQTQAATPAAAKQPAASPAAAEAASPSSLAGSLPPSTNAVAAGPASDGPASPRPLPATEQRSEPGLSEVSGGSGPMDVTSVAQDLERAEAQADRAALAEAARGASLGRRSGEAGAAAAAAGGESFTEEALQQEDLGPEATPSPEQPRGGPARPFSPPPRSSTPASQAGGGEASPEAFEPPEFRGLVFHDGVDALGRPVIVVDTDAVPPAVSRKAACAYMLQRLEPIVVQGPYVLVLLCTGRSARSNRLPAGWLASSYRELSYPFKKNVQHIVLVRPSATLRFMLALMRPLISRKAFVKLKRVENLTAIGPATNLEVTLQHLGPRFAAAAGQAILQAEGLGKGSGYAMPAMGSLELSQR